MNQTPFLDIFMTFWYLKADEMKNRNTKFNFLLLKSKSLLGQISMNWS